MDLIMQSGCVEQSDNLLATCNQTTIHIEAFGALKCGHDNPTLGSMHQTECQTSQYRSEGIDRNELVTNLPKCVLDVTLSKA